MLKKLLPTKESVIVALMIVFLLFSNIVYIYKYYKQKGEETVRETVVFNNDKEYDDNTIYYTEINYKKFNALLKKDKVSTIAVVDNSSGTYNKFLKLINKIAYYKRTNIYVLEVSKLSKKNEISFYEVDERLKKLESDYIISILDNKVISITSFDNEYLTFLIDNLK